MFSGIVESTGSVVEIDSAQLVVDATGIVEKLREGDSLSVNGACLTVTNVQGGNVRFGLMPETLRRTSLGRLTAGDVVNLESALVYGGQIGGHLMQGHVDATGELVSRDPDGDALVIGIKAPLSLTPYIVEKGFITVEGASLTIISINEAVFKISLVEYTQNATTLAKLPIGAELNLEVDMIAKYVERMLEDRNILTSTDL